MVYETDVNSMETKMTNYKMPIALSGASLTLCALGAFALVPASAMANESKAQTVYEQTEFEVVQATNGTVKLGVKAFQKGDYARSVALHKSALRQGLSSRKAAIVQTNLCASWAKLGDYVQAETACETALELRPDYGPAKANMNLITVKLAQN